MSLDLNQSQQTKQDFGRVDDGTYSGRVVQIIDIGRQQETAWVKGKAVPQYYVVDEDGKVVKNDEGYAKKTSEETSFPVIQPKVYMAFELPTETIEINDEQMPRWQSKEYNVTNSGALIKLVKALNPSASKISDIAGFPCMVTIGSTDSGNAKVTSVSPLMKGLEVAEVSKGPIVFDMSNPDMEVFNSLPDFLKEKIKASEGYDESKFQQGQDQAAGFDDFDDDIPY